MANPIPTLSPETLWNHLDYHEDTGHLSLKPDAPHPDITWRYSDCICVEGRNYAYARLSFYMHNGYMPKKIVRLNGDSTDIRIENLQEYIPQPKLKIRAGIPYRPATLPKPVKPRTALEQNRIDQQKLKAETALAKRRAKSRELYVKKLECEGKQLHSLTQPTTP